MTTDELTALAIKIHEEQKESDVEKLWAGLRRYIAHTAHKWDRAFQGKNGTTVDDLIQSGYFALLTALRNYDPEKGHFLNYFTFSLKHEFAQTLGLLSLESKNAPLDNSISIEAPVESKKTHDASSFDAFIPDPCAEKEFEDIENGIAQEQLRLVLLPLIERLSPREQKIIFKHFWEGISYAAIAEEECVCKQRIDQIKNRAFEKIRDFPESKSLRQFL